MYSDKDLYEYDKYEKTYECGECLATSYRGGVCEYCGQGVKKKL